MRQPLRTMKSLTVQRKLDWLNHCLYCDTNDIDIHVELFASHDHIAVYEIYHEIVYDVILCKTVEALYKILDRLALEARFHSHDTWYDNARYDTEHFNDLYW